MIKPSTPLIKIKSVPPRFLPKLKKLGIKSAGDLLRHFPIRYEDYREKTSIDKLAQGMQATIQGQVEEIDVRKSWRRRKMSVAEAIIKDNSGYIRAVWFNQPYIGNVLTPGKTVNISGKVSKSREGELYFSQPIYENVSKNSDESAEVEYGSDTPETTHTARLIPIYPETKGLTSRGIRFLILPLLDQIDFEEWIPEEILNSVNVMPLKEAYRAIHFPSSIKEAENANRRFAFETMFLLQLVNMLEKKEITKSKAYKIDVDIPWIKKTISKLPFELTKSQKRSLWEILQDMEKPGAMTRLLEGDVGSGKTIIAAVSAVTVAKNGSQTAFMAPTEILARQHFVSIKKLLTWLSQNKQPAIALLTSKEANVFYEPGVESSMSKKALLEQIAKGKISIVVGTHSLIQKTVSFKQLALAVVDEQHRFGVNQRKALTKSTKDDKAPHLLSMSATPIPRTLMLALFGDLDISYITELPSGRVPIVTNIIPPQERDPVAKKIREEVSKGRQVFVICPRIERSKDDSETETNNWNPWDDVKAVTEEYERLSKGVFKDFNIGMLHGKMKPDEKEKVMKKFALGKLDMLVSTSVVEVGIDVPNATVMVVEGSDRFGLAQLYQFRGRVGRGTQQSYCFLMVNSSSKIENARLKAIVKAKNGLELAEHDLKIRGPGQFLGRTQSGVPDLVMKNIQNLELIQNAHKAAEEATKINLSKNSNPELFRRLQNLKKQLHAE